MTLLDPGVRHEAVAATQETPAPSRWRRRAAIALVVAVGTWALLPTAVRLQPTVDVALAGDAGLLVEGYGAGGAYFLHYRHGETVTMTVPVHNESPLPLTVTGVDLVEPPYPLIEPATGALDAVTIAPFGTVQVPLTFVYANCRYYHERGTNTFDRAIVTGEVLGRDVVEQVHFAVPVVVHSQIILQCPDRTLVRGDDRRL